MRCRTNLVLSLGLLLVVACTLTAGAASAADTVLRWKFKQGDSMNYVMVNSREAKIDLSGSQVEFSLGTTFDTTWKVKSVSADGVADLEQTVDRIQVKVDSPLGGGINYDSKVPGSGEGQAWQMMGPMFEAMVGQTFSMKVSAIGKVTDIKIPEKISAELAKAAAAPGARRNPMAMLGGGLSEAGIKEMLERSFVLLPEKPVAQDVTWKQNFESVMKDAGVKKTEITYSTSESETADGHKIQKIIAKTELTFEPEADPKIDVEIDDQEGAATIAFDVDAGRTVKLDGKQKQTTVIAMPNREVSFEEVEKTTVRQGKSPEPKPADAKKDEKK